MSGPRRSSSLSSTLVIIIKYCVQISVLFTLIYKSLTLGRNYPLQNEFSRSPSRSLGQHQPWRRRLHALLRRHRAHSKLGEHTLRNRESFPRNGTHHEAGGSTGKDGGPTSGDRKNAPADCRNARFKFQGCCWNWSNYGLQARQIDHKGCP